MFRISCNVLSVVYWSRSFLVFFLELSIFPTYLIFLFWVKHLHWRITLTSSFLCPSLCCSCFFLLRILNLFVTICFDCVQNHRDKYFVLYLVMSNTTVNTIKLQIILIYVFLILEHSFRWISKSRMKLMKRVYGSRNMTISRESDIW